MMAAAMMSRDVMRCLIMATGMVARRVAGGVMLGLMMCGLVVGMGSVAMPMPMPVTMCLAVLMMDLRRAVRFAVNRMASLRIRIVQQRPMRAHLIQHGALRRCFILILRMGVIRGLIVHVVNDCSGGKSKTCHH